MTLLCEYECACEEIFSNINTASYDILQTTTHQQVSRPSEGLHQYRLNITLISVNFGFKKKLFGYSLVRRSILSIACKTTR